jgi:hypothetical protein
MERSSNDLKVISLFLAPAACVAAISKPIAAALILLKEVHTRYMRNAKVTGG